MNDSRSLMGCAIGKSEHPRGAFSAKIGESERVSTFVPARLNRGSIDAVRVQGHNHRGFGDCTATAKRSPPMSAGRWMATSSFCSSNTPMPRAAGSPTGRFFFLTLKLTSSQSEKIAMQVINAKCLDFALAQFYRSVHWNNWGAVNTF